MEGISANLLGQLDFIWKVGRIHPSPNAALFGKCCYLIICLIVSYST